MANIKDLATSTVATAPSPASSGTSLTVQSGHGARFPAASFYATVHQDGVLPTLDNAEVVLVTAVSTDTFTITRTQKGTSARAITIGDRISAAIFAEQVTPAGVINPYGGKTAPTGWLLCDGSAVSRTTYDALFQTIVPSVGTCTVTIASPAVVTLNSHGMQTGEPVYLTTTGALPTGLSANTLYYVIRIDANTFNLASSIANAIAGTKINTSGTQSGTHTLSWCPYGLGDGSTTFNVPDLRGRMVAGSDGMGGTLASRLTSASVLGAAGNTGGAETHSHTLSDNGAAEVLFANSTGADVIAMRRINISGSYTPTLGNSTSLTMHAFGGGAQTVGAALIGATDAANGLPPVAITNYIIKT